MRRVRVCVNGGYVGHVSSVHLSLFCISTSSSLPPLQISSCIQDLQELKAHTPTEHVDYNILHDVITELEIIQKVKTTTASRKTYPQAMSLSGSSK